MRVAHHEAAHFVVGALYGVPIIRIDMQPGAAYTAAIVTSDIMQWIGRDPLRADHAALYKLAGPSGEKRFLGGPDNALAAHAENDLKHVDRILAAVPTQTLAARRRYDLTKQTDSLLEHEACWTSVQALAQALAAEPRMEVERAKEIARIAQLQACLPV